MLDEVVRSERLQSLAFWTTDQCLVVPGSYLKKPFFHSAAARSSAEGWPVFARETGGDVVPQGSGILNISFALRSPETVETVYRMLCDPIGSLIPRGIADTRCATVPGSFCDGRFNVAAGGRKLAGTAQRWKSITSPSGVRAVFAHALLLVDADIQSGIDAINRFYQYCGLEQRITADAHINLSELIDIASGDSGLARLVRELEPKYKTTLEHAHSPPATAPWTHGKHSEPLRTHFPLDSDPVKKDYVRYEIH